MDDKEEKYFMPDFLENFDTQTSDVFYNIIKLIGQYCETSYREGIRDCILLFQSELPNVFKSMHAEQMVTHLLNYTHPNCDTSIHNAFKSSDLSLAVQWWILIKYPNLPKEISTIIDKLITDEY